MRRAAAILASVLLLVGCNATGPTPLPAPTATASTDPTPAPAATGFPTATDFFESELCPGGTGHTCRLEAGEHHSLGFGDGITFTLDDEWVVGANETDVISLEHGSATNPSVLELITGALRFETATPKVFEPVTDPERAEQRIAAIGGDRGPVTVVGQPPLTVGGPPTTIFDVTTDKLQPLFWYPVTLHESTLVPGRTARFMWLSWAGAPLIFSIESDTPTFDAFEDQVSPILASLEFGDGD